MDDLQLLREKEEEMLHKWQYQCLILNLKKNLSYCCAKSFLSVRIKICIDIWHFKFYLNIALSNSSTLKHVSGIHMRLVTFFARTVEEADSLMSVRCKI